MSHETVRFGGRWIGVAGVLSGLAIALGLPAIVLIYGQSLGHTVLTIVVILSLIIGGGVALVAAFFSLVIPSVVESNRPVKPGGTVDNIGGQPVVKDEHEE